MLLALVLLKPAASLMCLGSGSAGRTVYAIPGVRCVARRPAGRAMVRFVARCTVGVIRSAWAPAHSGGDHAGADLCGRADDGADRAARSFIVPMLLAIAIATLVARTIEPRSVYDARLSDEEVLKRQDQRNHTSSMT